MMRVQSSQAPDRGFARPRAAQDQRCPAGQGRAGKRGTATIGKAGIRPMTARRHASQGRASADDDLIRAHQAQHIARLLVQQV
jgi:hypothetical protein